MRLPAVSFRLLVLMGAIAAFVVPVMTARSPQPDLAELVRNARGSLDQMLQAVSPARQRAAADLIRQLEQQIQRAEAQLPVVAQLEADLQQARSRANSLKVALETAQGRSDQLQEQLRIMSQQVRADAENVDQYRAGILRKWGLQDGQQPEFELPREAGRMAQYEQDVREHAARRAAFERKWAGMPQFVQQAAAARAAASAAQRAHSEAAGDAARLERELQSKGAEFQRLGQDVGDGIQVLGGEGSGGPASGAGGGMGGGGGIGGPPMSPRPTGSNTSALDQLRTATVDQVNRSRGAAGTRHDCYDSGCGVTSSDAEIVIPNVSPKAASRLAENPGYQAATQQVERSATAFREAETTLLKLERSLTATAEQLQRAEKARNVAQGTLMMDRFKEKAYGLNLAPVDPREDARRQDASTPGGRGGQ